MDPQIIEDISEKSKIPKRTHEQLIFFLETVFQSTLESSLQLSRASAPPQTPFIHKYEAIKALKELIDITPQPYTFIIHTLLGELYSDVQQNSDSFKSYTTALKQFSLIPQNEACKYYDWLTVLYNMVGLSYVNKEELQEGLGCLAKAFDLYEQVKSLSPSNTYHNRSYPPKGRQFTCYYQGGIDMQLLQESHTLTLFYLAQVYTKVGLKDKGAQYCGKTLQRQYATNKYQVKQFCTNLIGLAQYYQGNKHFAQAQYLLVLALKVLPADQTKKTKLRATITMTLGHLLGELLEFSCNRLGKNDISQNDDKFISKKLITFEGFDQPFPQIKLPQDIEACKVLFRQANTQLKKALETYVLNGFVTDHINLIFHQARLYKALAILQPSIQRKVSMLEKRRDMLQPLLTELNSKAYPGTWQRILVQVADIYNEYFAGKTALVGGSKGIATEPKCKQAAQIGDKSIGFYRQIIKTLEEDKDCPRNDSYYRGIINSLINIAKTRNKQLSLDRKQRVQYLKQSLDTYQQILNYIEKKIENNLHSQFEKELELTKEMIAMMPGKIDKINSGMIPSTD